MPAGQFIFQPEVAVRDALARGAGLTDHVSPECPIALYGAGLTGDASHTWILGHYQHEGQALAGSEKTWLRRASGGMTLRAGAGVVYLALALFERSSLMKCPPGRLLNRNVRGVLTGLRHAGLAINYFGRDFLSLAAEPVIYVGWDMREGDRVLLEFFVAQKRAWFVPATEQAYPARSEPALRGRVPTTIARAHPQLSDKELVHAIVDGHARGFAVTWVEAAETGLFSASPSQAALQARVGSEALSWSRPREEAIGFVSAGVQLDTHGNFADVRIAGDFFAHRACTATLEAQLQGRAPNAREVSEAVDAAFARSGYDVEGIRSLSVIRDAILEAAECFHATTVSDPSD